MATAATTGVSSTASAPDELREQIVTTWREFITLSSRHWTASNSALAVSEAEVVLDASRPIRSISLWRMSDDESRYLASHGVRSERLFELRTFFRSAAERDVIPSRIIESGRVTVPSPYSSAVISTNESFVVGAQSLPGVVSIIARFEDVGRVFLVFQQIWLGQTIVIPLADEDVVIRLWDLNGDGEEQHLSRFRALVVSNWSSLCSYAQDTTPRRPTICIVHHRPSHQLMEELAGLYHLLTSGVLPRPAVILQTRETAMLSLDRASDANAGLTCESASVADLFEHALARRLLPFQASRRYPDRFSDARFLDWLKEMARAGWDLSETNAQILEARERSRFLLWFGIINKKRSWLQQSEAAVELARRLVMIFGRVGIVFDGWTSHHFDQTLDHEGIETDRRVVADISAKVPPGVTAYSIVGKHLAEKIAWAENVDAAVANSGTGALIVSRICRVPAVVHHNTREVAYYKQIDWETALEVPADAIAETDVMPDRPDYTSYSIAPAFIFDVLLELLAREGLVKPFSEPGDVR